MSGPTTPKDSALASLDEAIFEGRADEEVLPLLSFLNSLSDYATTSSCAGRIQLIELSEVGDKVGSRVLGKWHGPVTVDEVLSAIERSEGDAGLFLMAQPFLLHVRCRDLATAVGLWSLAHRAGLKFSTIRSVKLDASGVPTEWGITVELQGTERMEVPLGGIPAEALAVSIPVWVSHANSLMERIAKGRDLFLAMARDSLGRNGNK